MIKLDAILFQKFLKGELAHFYILKSPNNISNADDYLFNWCQTLLQKIIMHSKGNIDLDKAKRILELGHPDILILSPKEDASKYVVSDFDEFLRFQNYDNFEFPRRVIIIRNAHMISEVVANKLLKTLEEPHEKTTIFFLMPPTGHVLPTITSRAIQLLIPSEEPINTQETLLQTSGDLSSWLQTTLSEAAKPDSMFVLPKGAKDKLINFACNKQGFEELNDLVKKRPELENQFIKIGLEWQRAKTNSDYQQLDIALNSVKHFQLAASVNSLISERLFTALNRLFTT